MLYTNSNLQILYFLVCISMSVVFTLQLALVCSDLYMRCPSRKVLEAFFSCNPIHWSSCFGTIGFQRAWVRCTGIYNLFEVLRGRNVSVGP